MRLRTFLLRPVAATIRAPMPMPDLSTRPRRQGPSALAAAAALLLAACQAPHAFPEPGPNWTTHAGQLKQSRNGQGLIGEVLVRRNGARDFQLDLQKAGVPLIKLSATAGTLRAEGILARGTWEGAPGRAPARLRGWASLPEVFAAADAGLSPGQAAGARFTCERTGGRLSRLKVHEAVSQTDFDFVFSR